MTPQARQVTADLLPRARALIQAGHRLALLDSPAGSPAATTSHLLVLDAPRLETPPDPEGEHLCLATYDHGLDLLGVESRHDREMGFGLASFPVRARLTLDRATGRTEKTGQGDLFDLDPAPRPPGSPASGEFDGCPPVHRTHDREGFCDMVEQAKAFIREGHSYQTNLSLRLSAPFEEDPADLFDRLRATNPSPYQAVLVSPEATLVSASPELLVRTEGRRLVTRPIAGTRPRGATPEEDAALERELVASAKENAEHAMLVDLARNDLGRVARYGSVHVSGSTIVERYSHVMHLVSQVEAELAEGQTAWDAFEAIFPCGTITGAPKRRSCEIIDALEPIGRGAYTGSLGLVTPEASVWNILIRTAVLEEGHAHVQAGAGIVADSDPAREHEECLHKARALLEALGVEG